MIQLFVYQPTKTFVELPFLFLLINWTRNRFLFSFKNFIFSLSAYLGLIYCAVKVDGNTIKIKIEEIEHDTNTLTSNNQKSKYYMEELQAERNDYTKVKKNVAFRV